MINSSEEYRNAVDFAKAYINENRIKAGWDIATTKGSEGYLHRYVGKMLRASPLDGYPNLGLARAASGDFGGYSSEFAEKQRQERISSILKNASSEQTFHAILREIANQVEDGEELHPDLRAFLVAVLRGQLKPQSSGAGRGKAECLHTLIAHGVAELIEVFRIKPLRNDESTNTSACDIVAQALAEMSLSPITYAGVKRIWLSWDKTFWLKLS